VDTLPEGFTKFVKMMFSFKSYTTVFGEIKIAAKIYWIFVERPTLDVSMPVIVVAVLFGPKSRSKSLAKMANKIGRQVSCRSSPKSLWNKTTDSVGQKFDTQLGGRTMLWLGGLVVQLYLSERFFVAHFWDLCVIECAMVTRVL